MACDGISGPILFGNIIGTGNAGSFFVAYLVGATGKSAAASAT